MKSKIGVYICQCGSNISDYVDVEKVRDEVATMDGVALARTTMFACSDSAQNEIIEDIRNEHLDAIVVASCSPKLHLFTFRNVAIRGGLNPYNYVQVNIREQDSWAHSDNPAEATIKAVKLVKAGIERVKYSEALVPIDIPATNRVLVIGAGVAGMRAAIDLSSMGTKVYLIEREHFVGGRTSQWSRLFTSNETGEEVVYRLYNQVEKDPNITLYTGTELVSMKGTVGNFVATITITPRYISPGCNIDEDAELEKRLQKAIDACPVEIPDPFNFNIATQKALYRNFHSEFPVCPAIDMKSCTRCGECKKYLEYVDLDQQEETLDLHIGAIITATGFDTYEPEPSLYGYQTLDNVITLPQFKRLIELNEEKLTFHNRHIRNIAYIYCVGSRQTEGENKYCSRYCCTSAIHAAIHAKSKYEGINNYHFNRGIRTYGKQETLYSEALENGDVFLQFDEDHPPTVDLKSGKTSVTVRDILTSDHEITALVDLVVLVTAMVPRAHNQVAGILKIPVGRDHFFNEIHPKLKPVETVIDGIFICGACQAPHNITESTKSALSAASKANAMLREEKIKLEPTIAKISAELCTWCNACSEICPFDAITKKQFNGKDIARVDESICKGCGMCLPVCDQNAIELIGYTDTEIESMIDQLAV
ncbi:MAG: CoB--CoM heterodisulfide reductase iron-sulfur subunit A family protein [Bacteroidales bacterium]